MGGLKKTLEVFEIAVTGMDGSVIGNVVAVIAQRRGKEWHQPDGVDAQFLQIIELLRQAAKIADSIRIGVVKRADVDLVNDGVLVPELVLRQGQKLSLRSSLLIQNNRSRFQCAPAAGCKRCERVSAVGLSST